jgi:putative aminopeptidase FrvX
MSIELIRKFSEGFGVSGFEDEIVDIGKENLDKKLILEEDRMRNLFIRREDHDESKLTVLVDGHSDEVGFLVQSILDNGLIKFITIGGWLSQVVLGQRVVIKNRSGKKVKGVISSTPPHFLSGDKKNKVIDVDDMYIDVGSLNRDETMNTFGINIGDPIVPLSEFIHNDCNDTIMGKAFDDRLGCSAVVEIMNSNVSRKLDYNLVGSLSTQEEAGLRGARIVANKVKPDLAIIFEGTPADDVIKSGSQSQASLGKGPQLRHRDNSMIANPRLMRFVIDLADALDIKYQEAVRQGGGTNAGAIHLSNEGVPTVVIGVPVRYIHSPQGIFKYEDYENAIRLANKIIESLNSDIIKKF